MNKTETTFPFNLWLYCEMTKNGMDVLDVEIGTGITATTITNYLKGATTPTLNNLAKILALFDKHIEIVDNAGGQHEKEHHELVV